MCRFFFHLKSNAEGLSLDEFGVDLLDAEAAYLEAYQAAKDISQEWLAQGRNPRSNSFQVENSFGEIVFELPFEEVLDRLAGRRFTPPSTAIRTALERGSKLKHLSSELAAQVELAAENIRHSQDLLRSLGRGLGNSH